MQGSVRAVLAGLAAELSQLAVAAESLQSKLGAGVHGRVELASAAVEPGDQAGTDLLISLQSLDHITQTLQCLAPFVAAAARLGCECQIDLAGALAAVRLSKLQHRLTGTGGAEWGAETELFGSV